MIQAARIREQEKRSKEYMDIGPVASIGTSPTVCGEDKSGAAIAEACLFC